MKKMGILHVYPVNLVITFQLGSFVWIRSRDPICTTNLMKQHDRYLATQECFMDYQIASPIRIVTVKMIMSLFLLRMNFTLKKERRITVTPNSVQEIRRSHLRDKFCNFEMVTHHRCCFTSHITYIHDHKINIYIKIFYRDLFHFYYRQLFYYFI